MDIETGRSYGGQLRDSPDRVKAIGFKANSNNGESIYWGIEGVSETNGWELVPGESDFTDFNKVIAEGSLPLNKFYCSVSGGDSVHWKAIKE